MDYFWLFVSGMLAFNAVPHLVHGISGLPFFLPRIRQLGKRGTSVANTLWGFTNILLAVLICRSVFHWSAEVFGRVLATLAGGLLIAVGLSLSMARRAKMGE
ncbi:MAG: hypothetical protein FWD59_00585 [Micrococcales bacterium]|nr:hypothetical protein [Micrococcales bacterium]